VNEVFVTEIFNSFQGEGPYIGVPSLFVRFFGCNNDCAFCDSKYSTKMNKDIHRYTFDELVNMIKDSSNHKHVVFTGGEPLLQQEFLEYYFMKTDNHDVEIETNGLIYPVNILKQWHYNVSPKLSNSGNKISKVYLNALIANVLRYKIDKRHFILKFVVDPKTFTSDIQEIFCFLADTRMFNETTYLMPMGKTEEEIKFGIDFISHEIKRIPFPFVIAPRLHVLVYGNKRGV